jgi:PhnB protein
MLYIPGGIKELDFYTTAFDAELLRKWTNDDGSIHAAELSIQGTLFFVHEENNGKMLKSPGRHAGTTVNIGLFVPDVDAALTKALAAGARLIAEAQDYDYGYRQAEIADPFGHIWTIQKRI